MTTVGLLLAAGRSERFGREDKLLAPLWGAPLVTHAARVLVGAGCDQLIAVTSSPAVADVLPGFEIVGIGERAPLQSDSLRAGIARAKGLGADQALIALGDMPCVSLATLQELLRICPAGGASAATDGLRRMPPACFASELFSALLDLKGDQGARAFLKDLPLDACVRVAGQELLDIDTVEDLRRAESSLDTAP